MAWSGREVVQFSHFSVKEFLMSNRLTSPLGDLSRYQIHPGSSAHHLHAVLSRFSSPFGRSRQRKHVNRFPLANYAAQHWVEHAQFEDVASRVMDGMETLFDFDKPHFAAWIRMHDIDRPKVSWSDFSDSEISPKPKPNPVYYSVLCGFHDLVKHLAIKYPQHIDAICGRYKFPLFAALSEDHVEIAELLLEHGADVDVRETTGETILLKVLSRPQHNLVNIVRLLLRHGADVNARDDARRSSLHLAEYRGELEVAQMLLKHEADINSQDNNGKTPLHILSGRQRYNEDDVVNHARLLLEHGAEVNRRDKNNQTPLLLATKWPWFKLMRMFLEHGADANAENNNGKTPLHILSEHRMYRDNEDDVVNHVQLLLEHGAEVNRRDKNNQMPLLLAMGRDLFKVARTLLEHGADASAKNYNSKTPLHLLSETWIHGESDALDLISLLLEHGAVVNSQDQNNQTPLLLAMGRDWFKLARILLDHGADANMKKNNGKTPLHLLLESQIHHEGEALDLIWLLLEHGAVVNRRDDNNQTPLLLAMGRDWFKLARVLLKHGAGVNVENNDGKTLLHLLSESRVHNSDALDLVSLLLEHGVEVNRRDKNNGTPLLLAMGRGWFKLARILLDHGADANVKKNNGKTPLHLLLESQIHNEGEALDLMWPLLEHGAVVNSRDINNQMPLHLAKNRGWFKLAQILLEHGADASAEDNNSKTPLHLLSESEIHDEGKVLNLMWPLLEHGAVVNSRDINNQMPLHLAMKRGWFKLARIFLEHGADASAEDNNGMTPLHILSELQMYEEDEVLNHTRLLLEHGAEVNRQDNDNQTPLLLAMGRDWFKLALILLEHGADANAENNNGKTPLHILSKLSLYNKGDVGDVLRLRLEHGAAEVNRRYKVHETPLLLEIGTGMYKFAWNLSS
jgi:cytohesin